MIFVTLTIPAGDRGQEQAVVNGIHDSMEQAAKLVAKHVDHRVDAFAWKQAAPPRIGEMVRIVDGQVRSQRRPALLDLVNAAVKRHELERLRSTNEALTQRNSLLASRLELKRHITHAYLERQLTTCQARYLWIASTPDGARENIVSDYVNYRLPSRYERIMLAPDQPTVDRLNLLAQENRLQEADFERSRGLAHERVLLHAGDRVYLPQERQEWDVRRGDLGEIVYVDSRTRTVAVLLDREIKKDDHLVFLPLREYPHVALGYAATYEQASQLQLEYAMVLAWRESPAAAFVESLTARFVEIHCDRLTAAVHFPRLLSRESSEHVHQIDHEADPLRDHIQER